MLASYQLCAQTANAPLITYTLEGIFIRCVEMKCREIKMCQFYVLLKYVLFVCASEIIRNQAFDYYTITK